MSGEPLKRRFQFLVLKLSPFPFSLLNALQISTVGSKRRISSKKLKYLTTISAAVLCWDMILAVHDRHWQSIKQQSMLKSQKTWEIHKLLGSHQLLLSNFKLFVHLSSEGFKSFKILRCLLFHHFFFLAWSVLCLCLSAQIVQCAFCLRSALVYFAVWRSSVFPFELPLQFPLSPVCTSLLLLQLKLLSRLV